MKHLLNLLGISTIYLVIFGVMVFVEMDTVLSDRIIPVPGIKLEQWLDTFKWFATVGLALSLAATLLWYGLAQWVWKVNSWRSANRRPFWYFLLTLPVAGTVVGIVLTGQSQEGLIIAYVFYALNGLVSYYLATVLFSPSSFKFTPVGASILRNW